MRYYSPWRNCLFVGSSLLFGMFLAAGLIYAAAYYSDQCSLPKKCSITSNSLSNYFVIGAFIIPIVCLIIGVFLVTHKRNRDR